MNGQHEAKVLDEVLALMNKFCETECDGFMIRCAACKQEAAKQVLSIARTKQINGKG